MATKQITRLLILADDKFPPFRVDVATLFGKKLSKMSYEIDWILQSASKCNKSYKTSWEGCDVFVGKTCTKSSLFGRFRKHIYTLINDIKVFRLLSENKYDLVQVKDKFLTALIVIIAAKIYKIPFVYWLSYPFPEASIYEAKIGTARYPILYLIRGTIFKLFLYKIILPNANYIFVQSAQMKRDICTNGVSESKISAIPMGVEIENIPFDQINNVDNIKKRVLYLGTLIKVRRLDFLIRVFAKVVDAIPEAVLYLVGDGENDSDIELLKTEISKHKIENQVIFTGFLKMEDAWEYVKKADVCVSPFYPTFILNSTSPTKLIEYMSMGKPVVANDHPEQSLVIKESGGGICVKYDYSEFADAVIYLLRNADISKKMGVQGREYVVKRRSYTAIAFYVDEIYQQIVLKQHN